MRQHTSRAQPSAIHTQGVLATLFALWLTGCGGAAPAPITADEAQESTSEPVDSTSRAFGDVRVNPDAEAVKLDCEDNAFEQCNALDDDCNGVIDDQCGYESGVVQITVGWNSGADIDLYVTDPSGATLFYNKQNKRSKIGGHLDHDARGDCRREQQNPRIENVYWGSPGRPGNYRVELHYFSPCAKGATTEATLSVVVESELLGAYRFQLEPEQRIEALSFVKR